MKLINSLKVWRAKLNITQAELAEAVSLSRQTINSIEKGVFCPSIVSALKLAAFFQTTVEELFTLVEEQ
jgi:putative transcriptional regulator